MSRQSLAIPVLLLASCRLLPAPPPKTPAGTKPLPKRPAGLSAEDLRTWHEEDELRTTFGLRTTAILERKTPTGGVHVRESTFTAWRGACRIDEASTVCRIWTTGTSTVEMALAIQGDRGVWIDPAGELSITIGEDALIEEKGRTLARVALDERPPSGWLDVDLPEVDRVRIAPLLLTLATLPAPEPRIQATRTSTKTALSRFTASEAASQEMSQPLWGPDFRSTRPLFFVIELVGLGGSFPLSLEEPAEGAPTSISPRFGYSLSTGLDYRDFVQVFVGVEARGVAFDADELERLSPAGAFDVRGKLRVSVGGRVTLFRAGPIGAYVGLEHLWLLSDEDSVFYQTSDADTRIDRGFTVMADFTGDGWAPQVGVRYKLGPVLRGGDWWSGISADILLEGRYELVEWSPAAVRYVSLSEDPGTIANAEELAEAWAAAYATPRHSRHGGVRVAFQIRF